MIDQDQIWARSLRFAATVATPIGVGWALGAAPWFVYAIVTSIVSYAADIGGRPLPRLAWMATGGGALVLGGACGTLAGAEHWTIMAGFALCGVIYALVESAHHLALTAARFLCFGFAIGALYIPIAAVDVLAAVVALLFAWLVSVSWDGARGAWRVSTAPSRQELRFMLQIRARERWIFAVAVAVAVPLAYWTSLALGLPRPYWTLLAFVLVLRVDFLSSRRLMVERFLGTVLGVVIAGGYAMLLPSHVALMIGIVIAALARWPAQQKHGALGVGALTAFAMLMIELIAATGGQTLGLLEARVLDTAVGCGFAGFALLLDRSLRWSLARLFGLTSR